MRTITALCAVALTLAVADPAAAAPKTRLVLSYMAEAGYAAAVTLRCEPAGGAHPKPARACTTLRKAGGKPGRIEPAQMMCTLEYAPITAEVRGSWRGKAVRWSKTFPNRCDLTRATGILFAF
ncbi:MAG TPA: SSI family serine proteinase inhibitor [Actinoplanes sp.]|nr:SSI family serine proteinase inhibitor [Actinoplanes sp.]